jgi:hypothetical protein
LLESSTEILIVWFVDVGDRGDFGDYGDSSMAQWLNPDGELGARALAS